MRYAFSRYSYASSAGQNTQFFRLTQFYPLLTLFLPSYPFWVIALGKERDQIFTQLPFAPFLERGWVSDTARCPAACKEYQLISDQIYRAPPYLGQHTDEVLAELGYGLAEIDSMRAQGVV